MHHDNSLFLKYRYGTYINLNLFAFIIISIEVKDSVKTTLAQPSMPSMDQCSVQHWIMVGPTLLCYLNRCQVKPHCFSVVSISWIRR